MSINHLRIATRSSKLALKQSSDVRDMIAAANPDIEISFVQVTTKGDTDKSDFLYKGSSVGYFTSAVEETLLNNQADIAVHSLKDLPTTITPGLTIAAIPTRQDVSDAVISNHNIASLEDLPQGAIVGTSSLRRIAQVKHYRPDLNCQPLRGNIETRIEKVKDKQYDAIILAKAGLNRLGLDNHVSFAFDPADFLPAPGQGALAIQIRSDDKELLEMLKPLDDHDARITSTAERLVLSKLHGGCSIPLGVYSIIKGDNIAITAMLSEVDASDYIITTKHCAIDKIKSAAKVIVSELLDLGGRYILEKLRD